MLRTLLSAAALVLACSGANAQNYYPSKSGAGNSIPGAVLHCTGPMTINGNTVTGAVPCGNAANPIYFVLAVAPSAPQSFAAGTATQTTIPLSWSAPSTGNPSTYTYSIGYALHGTGLYAYVTTTALTYTLAMLQPNTAYDLTITANNQYATGPAATITNISTTQFANYLPVVGVGDSILGYFSQGDTYGSTHLSLDTYSNSEWGWAWSQDPIVNLNTWYNSSSLNYYSPGGVTPTSYNSGFNNGYFGDHMEAVGSVPGIVPRLKSILAASNCATTTPIFLLEGGTNSIATGDTPGSNTPATVAYMEAEYTKEFQALQASGCYGIFEDLLPRSDFSPSDPRTAEIQTLNTWLATNVPLNGFTYIPRYNTFVLADGTPNMLYLQPDDAAATTAAQSASTSGATDTLSLNGSGICPQFGVGLYPFNVVVDYYNGSAEYEQVTGPAVSNVAPVLRGQEGTSAVAHSSGAVVDCGGIHPNPNGAAASGAANILPVIQKLFVSTAGSNSPTFDASAASNIQSAKAFTLTPTGTPTAPATGVIPKNISNATVNTSNGTTAVFSVPTKDGTHNYIQIVITPGNLSSTAIDNVYIQSADLTTGIPAAGSWLYATAHVCIGNTSFIGMVRGQLIATISGTSPYIATYDQTNVSTQQGWLTPQYANQCYQMWFDPMKLQSGQTYVRIRMYIYIYFPNNATGTPTVTIDNWYVGPMTAPYTAFGLNAATP